MKYDLSNNYKKQCAKEYFDKLIEKKAYIEVREVRMKRSLDQNALYWLWLTAIEKETGNNKEVLHLLYRSLFLCKPDEYITKIIIPGLWAKIKAKIEGFVSFDGHHDIIDLISKSTTLLDSKEYTDYLNQIKDHAFVNMNVVLLTLEDENFKDFYREYYKY